MLTWPGAAHVLPGFLDPGTKLPLGGNPQLVPLVSSCTTKPCPGPALACNLGAEKEIKTLCLERGKTSAMHLRPVSSAGQAARCISKRSTATGLLRGIGDRWCSPPQFPAGPEVWQLPPPSAVLGPGCLWKLQTSVSWNQLSRA